MEHILPSIESQASYHRLGSQYHGPVFAFEVEPTQWLKDVQPQSNIKVLRMRKPAAQRNQWSEAVAQLFVWLKIVRFLYCAPNMVLVSSLWNLHFKWNLVSKTSNTISDYHFVAANVEPPRHSDGPCPAAAMDLEAPTTDRKKATVWSRLGVAEHLDVSPLSMFCFQSVALPEFTFQGKWVKTSEHIGLFFFSVSFSVRATLRGQKVFAIFCRIFFARRWV